MMSIAKTRGPCSGPQAVDPPPDPPPPRKPFPWIYVWAVWAFMGFMGLLYKYYLYRQTFATPPNSQWQPRRLQRRPRYEEDIPPCVQYLIIGSGTAGWSAYQAIRELDKTAKVLIVSKEDIWPYARPAMSKYMWYNSQPPDVTTLNYIADTKRQSMFYAHAKDFMDPVKFYRKKKGPALSLVSGWCILRVDADEHIAWVKTFCGERPIYYERCLIAAGSKPKNLTIFKKASKAVRKKVCLLRTIRDLEIAYRGVRNAKHVTIIGGGPLGTELAYHMARMHKFWVPPPEDDFVPIQIAHVIKTPGILGNILPDYLGVWASEKLKCENVNVIPNTCVYDAYESPDGRVTLTLSNGDSLDTDYVFVCIGTVPSDEMAEDSFLEVDSINGGFMVNAELQIRKHLWVAGDAASVYCPWKDTRIRMDHILNAEEQGHIAGLNMAGMWTPCLMEPHYWVQLGDVLSMEVIGEVGACMPTIGVFLPCEESEETMKYDMSIGEYGKPCFKQSSEYKQRFRRGIVYYLREHIVVGIAFWNLPPIEDRLEVTTEILRAKPTFDMINILTELLGMGDVNCVDVVSDGNPPGEPCTVIMKRKYED